MSVSQSVSQTLSVRLSISASFRRQMSVSHAQTSSVNVYLKRRDTAACVVDNFLTVAATHRAHAPRAAAAADGRGPRRRIISLPTVSRL